MEELINLSRRNFLTKAGIGLAGIAMSSFDVIKEKGDINVKKFVL